MTFPHLPDSTPFPANDTHVYRQYRNTFDYNMWTPDTRLKLCNVDFRDDYHDVVKFADDDERDAYFKNLDGESVTLTSAMYIARADSDGVKLPVPYATMQKYNYLVIDFTKNIGKLPLQDADVQITYHYFITDIRADSPNTTTVMLERDVWTDCINHVELRNLALERGHAPLVETTPTQLLANPLENSIDMLMPDVSYADGNPRITAARGFNLNRGDMSICFALTCDARQLGEMASHVGVPTSDTAPVYDDNTGALSSGFEWGAGGIDTSGCAGEYTPFASADDFTANNLNIFAVDSESVTGAYLNDLFARCPQILGAVRFMCVIPTKCLRFSEEKAGVLGIDWFVVKAKRDNILTTYTLQPSDFNIPADYANITKLYVSPYSVLEITDGMGNEIATVRVEDTRGRLTLHEAASIAMPLARRVVWFDGIGCRESLPQSLTMTMKKLNGGYEDTELPISDIRRAVMEWDIPLYALQVRESDLLRMRVYNKQVRQRRDAAITSYDNAVRSANTTLTNTNASADNALTNTNASADTALSNTNASADTALANTNASADTAMSNADSSADTALTNANASAKAAFDNAAATLILTNQTIGWRERDWNRLYVKQYLQNYTRNKVVKTAQNYNTDTTQVECVSEMWNLTNAYAYQSDTNENINAFMDASVVEGLTQAALATLMSGAIGVAGAEAAAGVGFTDSPLAGSGSHAAIPTGGSVSRARVGAVGQMASLGVAVAPVTAMQNQKTLNAANLLSMVNNNSRIAEKYYSDRQNSFKWQSNSLANANISDTAENKIAFDNDVADQNFDRTTKNLADTKNTGDANNTRTYNAATGNAARTNSNTKAVASATNTTTKENARRTNANTKAVASATNTTVKENARRTNANTKSIAKSARDTEIANLRSNMELARLDVNRAYADSGSSGTSEVGRYEALSLDDSLGRRAVTLKIRTQPLGALSRAGDYFSRFGVASNKIYMEPTLNMCRHFTYWKASELTIIGAHVLPRFVSVLRDIFERGVTVWRHADEIGRVDIHKNL